MDNAKLKEELQRRTAARIDIKGAVCTHCGAHGKYCRKAIWSTWGDAPATHEVCEPLCFECARLEYLALNLARS